MAASYNLSGLGGKTAIAPSTYVGFTGASVRTLYGAQAARAVEYSYPGISGAVLVRAGIPARDVTWQMVIYAASMAGFDAFESLLKPYLELGGEYTLIDEFGRTLSGVEMVEWAPREVADRALSSGLVLAADLQFRWMRPS